MELNNIPLCPMTGKPCFHKKTHHVQEIKDYTLIEEHHMCDGCFPTYVQLTNVGQEPMLFSTPPVVQPQPQAKNVPVKHVETIDELFDIFTMQSKSKNEPTIACPSCGMTPAEFQKNNKMGCSDCYKYYEKDVPDILLGCHKAVKHVGKQPKKPQGTPEEIKNQLKIRLAQAVEQEQYEEASKLKKQIAEMDTQEMKQNEEQ